MSVGEFYKSITRRPELTNDFELFKFKDFFFIGFDSEGFLCVVVTAINSGHKPIIQQTRLLSVECNRLIQFVLSGEKKNALVHIVKCLSQKEKEKTLFLELLESIINYEVSDEEILDAFRTLSDFFKDRIEPSDNELIGLYAELDAMISFPSIQLEKYWQSQDRMKFDFSITDALKIEVKATTKPFRTHHFRHEQLVTDLYDIVILSYMLRYDDEGVSLLDLINQVKPRLMHNPKKLLRIDRILKNVSEDRLKSLRFNPDYTREKRHFFYANDIPKFPESTPDGVANAEYDCSLDNIRFVSDAEVFELIKKAILEESSNEQAG